MKLTAALLLASTIVLAGSRSALAQDTGEKPKPAPDYSWFSAGVGVGFGSYEGSSIYGLGSLFSNGTLAPGRTPIGTALVEVVLTQRLRLGIGASGAYLTLSHEDERDDSDDSYAFPREQSQLAAALNLRYVMNPGGVIEVSPMLSVGGHRSTANGLASTYVPAEDEGGDGYHLKADAVGYGVDARLALVLEYRLLPQLYLRLESYFARIGHDDIDAVTDTGSEKQHERSKQTSLAFGWQPALDLRFAF